jgi:putative ABC transport system permease protein
MRSLERFLQDVRYSARSLRRSPGFALTAMLVLALGIGANSAIFSVAKDVLLRPLPYPEPDRLVQYISRSRTGRSALASVPKYNAWRAGLRIHEAVTAYRGGGPGVTLADGDRREHLDAIYATASYFRVFRAPMLHGRAFTLREDQPQGPKVAVISHAFSLRRFGRHQNPVGLPLALGDGLYEIVGVLGASFRPQPHADVILPLQAPAVSFNHTNDLTVVARLKPAIPTGKADAELAATTVPFHTIFPDTTGPYEQFGAEPLELMLAGDSRPALQMLGAAVVFVLLIACANAANLFVVRAARRKADIATRAALGAGRTRLIRLLFTECMLLALGAGALGLAIGYAGIRGLIAAVPGALAPTAGADGGGAFGTADSSVVLFTLAVSVLTAVTFGLLPVLRASRVDLSGALKDNAAAGTTATRHTRQSLLVVAEMTLAIVLLVGAGLLTRTFLAQRTIDRGFRSSGLIAVDLPLTTPAFQHAAAVDALVRDVRVRVGATPAAPSIAAAYSMPLEPTLSLPFTLLNRPLQTAPYHGVGFWRSVSADYFGVFGMPILRGRGFNDRDTTGSLRVVVINRSMARRLWQDIDRAVGEKILIGKSADREFDEQPRFIIGVVADARDTGSNRDPEPAMYVPIAQTGDRMMARNNRQYPLTFLVRTDIEGAPARRTIEQALRDAAGGLPIARVRRIEDIVRAATAQLEFTTILLGVFAVAALVLAAIGLYGLMAYSVEQRRQEIGIRLALGADPGMLRNMVLAHGGQLAAAGVCLGLACAFAGARVMASIVVGLAPWDTTVFATVAALLAVVSLAAAYLPAQDATRTDPLRALRSS